MSLIDVHIGTHKTASTTIQHALKNAVDAQVNEGWHYVHFSELLKPELSARMISAESPDDQVTQSIRENLALRMTANSKGDSAQRFVLSWEGFSGNARNAYRNSNALATMLRTATEIHTVRIIVYLRRQDDFVQSMYTQTIHEGGTQSFSEFLKDFNGFGFLNYQSLLGNYEREFGKENMVVRSYHAAASRGMVRDFGEVIQSKYLREYQQEKRRNPSYSRAALEIAKLANHQLNAEQKKALRHVLQNSSPREPSDSFNFFNAEQRSQYLEQCAASNQAVAKRYFADEVAQLFLDNPEQSDRSYDFCAEQVAPIVVALLKQVEEPKSKNGSALDRVQAYLSKHPRMTRFLHRVFRLNRKTE
jgi:hypothetical protein